MAEVDVRVVAIAVAALASVWPPRPSTRAALAAASGTLIVTSSWSATFENRTLDWAAVAVVAIAVALGWAVPILYDFFTAPMYGWVVIAGCLGAVHVCVPENGQTAEIGLLVACAGVAELLTRRRLPLPVWSAAVAAVLWTAVYGASGQSRAVIGGLYAVGVLIAMSFVLRGRRTDRRPSESRRWLVVLVWLASAWTVARTGGVADTAAAAWVAVAIATVIAGALVVPIRFAVRS